MLLFRTILWIQNYLTEDLKYTSSNLLAIIHRKTLINPISYNHIYMQLLNKVFSLSRVNLEYYGL